MVRSISQFDSGELWPAYRPKAPSPPPKLIPNSFARATKWCYENAKFVIAFWLILASIAVAGSVWNFQKPKGADRPFPALKTRELAGAEVFAKLSRLQIITLSNPDPHELTSARDSVVASLTQRPDLVETIVAPSTGAYFEDHSLLYRPLSEVQARVAYALSMKPLFEAVQASPDSSSMATLLSGLAGAVAQGRDPQGLDDMMAEAAISVQALIIGEDHALDWAKIADLEFESTATKSVVSVLPVEGQDAEAAAYVASLAKAAGLEIETTGISAQSEIKTKADTPRGFDRTRLIAALLMGFVFSALLLAIVLGRAIIISVVGAPILISAPISFAVALWLGQSSWLSYWPIIAFGILVPATLSLGLVLEAAMISPQLANEETAMMVAAHYNGKRLLLRGLLLAAPFCGLALLSSPAGFAPVITVLALGIFGIAVSFSLPAAMSGLLEGALDWRAAKWWEPAHRSLFETGQWQILSHGLGVVLVLAAVVTAFISIRKPEPIMQTSQSVAVLAQDQAEAEKLIARLRGVPSAAAVQWLGGFLGDQAAEKREELRRLDGQFSRIEPVGWVNPADVRDVVEAMQDSLRLVSQASSARPSLKESADAFRQSLAILAATSEDKKMRELDNRLFGGFNRLADRADTLANLKQQSLEDLPNELQTLFGAPPGPYRIVVLPVDGVPPGQLAETLGQLGFPVLHPAVVAEQTAAAKKKSLIWLLLAGGVLTILLLALATRGLVNLGRTVLVGAAAVIVLMACEFVWQQEWNLQWLLALCLLLGWLSSSLVAAAPHEPATLTSALNVFLIPALVLLIALPLALLGVDAASGLILPVAIAMLATSITIGLFQLHGPRDTY